MHSRYEFPALNLSCACVPIKSLPTFSDPKASSLPGSSVHGILQERILDWLAMMLWGLSLATALHICSAGALHPPCVIRPPPALLGLDTLPSLSRHWRECHPCLAPPSACSPHWCSPPFPLQSKLRRSLCPSVLFPAHCQETEHVSVVGVRDPPTPLDPHLDEGHRELSVRMTEV